MEEPDLKVYRNMQAKLDEFLKSSWQNPLPSFPSTTQFGKPLQKALPDEGYGLEKTCEHLLQDVVPGLNGQSLSPTYYGFVTGGITPAARVADNIVTLFDQNVAVHLPDESIATFVEDRALCLLLELFNFDVSQWPMRTITTGATASNILGLACGREFLISEKLVRKGLELRQGEGIISSCLRAGIGKFQVCSTLPHSSLGKAANVVGVGSETMIDVSRDDHFLDFDLIKLEKHLSAPQSASIVVISCGEVNTGAFATHSIEDVQAIRKLCDHYGAWLHVDAAFGLFARALPTTSEYATIRAGTEGLELADSIGSDGHKLLNVPYDCGFFFSRHREIPSRVFGNTNAAYLKSSSADGIASPLNIRIENSSRFRGLPVYATLLAYGRSGYSAMVSRMVDLARKISVFIRDECPQLELLPLDTHQRSVENVYICVLFRAKDDSLNKGLTERVKSSQRVYVSGTEWDGKTAVRFAIAKWDVDVQRDFDVVKDVLRSII